MRFLHTSDWHVGKTLRSEKRDAEYRGALEEILDIARREKVDCVLIAGDVFDSVMPPPEAERIVFDFFRELAGERIPAVIIGGNHDHPKRLAAFSRILDLIDIHVRGDPVLPNEGGIVEVASRDGSENAVVAALPWVPERKVRDWESLMSGGQHYEDYAEGVAQMIGHLCKAFRKDAINIFLSHVMMDGAITGGESSGERPLHTGQAYAVKPQRLPSDAGYIALGHLHRPQAILPGRAFYSGSLIQLDFGEAGQEKSVCVVDAAPGRPPHVEHVPLTAGRQLRKIEGNLDQLRVLADTVGDAYLCVFVRVDQPVQGLAEQVRALFPNAVAVIPVYPPTAGQVTEPSLIRLSPAEMFVEYYKTAHANEPESALMELFNKLYQDASDEAA
jgi:exonuclease SbcD